MNTPTPSPCSQCGNMIEPVLMDTSIDSNYKTVYHWSIGHTCPKQLEHYDNRITEINNSEMSEDQKTNARMCVGMMNAWAA